MSKVELEEETIDAAGIAVRGLDAGRRVGWARAFDALRRADSAEHDVNVLRADVKTLSSFAARIYGALMEVVTQNQLNELFRGDNIDLEGFLPEGPLFKGKDAMRNLLAKEESRLAKSVRHHTEMLANQQVKLATEKARLAELKADRMALSDKAFETARRMELERLMEQFGIPDEAELTRWLTRYARYARKGKA